METISNFIFWTSLYFAIIGLLQWLFVRKAASPTQNRWFIILGLISSIIVVALNISTMESSLQTINNAFVLPEVIVGASNTLEFTQKEIFYTLSNQSSFATIALLISLFFAIRMIASIIYLFTRVHFGNKKQVQGCTVFPVNRNISPFSFFGFIFIPQSLLNESSLIPILIHERAHGKKMHSLDLVFVEMLTIVFWFHPAVWYLRKELKLQHEFEADSMVLKHNIKKSLYQKLLIDMSTCKSNYLIINSFTYSPIKKRLIMMNKTIKNKNAVAIFSILFMLPIFAALVMLQSCDQKQVGQDEQEKPKAEIKIIEEGERVAEAKYIVEQGDTLFTIPNYAPVFPGGNQELMSFLQKNLNYPVAAKQAGIQGTVFVSFIVKNDGQVSNIEILRGVSPDLDAEALRVLGLMPKWQPGRLDSGKEVNTQFNMPVRFVLN
jgi:TonB family protein